MIDHVSVRVMDFDRALAFYKAALAPIGYDVIMQFEAAAGLGHKGKPDLWIMKTDQAVNPAHVAISAGRAEIDAFHAAALAAGGVDNGPPGLRADYHPFYYAAFVHDADGNNIEVVCHVDPKAAVAPKAAAKKPAKKAAKVVAKAAVKKPAAKKPAAKAKPAAKKAAKKPAGKKRR